MKKEHKWLSPVGSILPSDMIEYKTSFSIEDFDAAVQEFSSQWKNHQHSPIWLVSSKEQADMLWEDYHDSVVKTINKYINRNNEDSD